jgi:hypothetical protein
MTVSFSSGSFSDGSFSTGPGVQRGGFGTRPGRTRHYAIDDYEPERKKPQKVKTKPKNVVVEEAVSKPSRWEKPNDLINQAISQYNQQVMDGEQADAIARFRMDEEDAICLLLLVA